MTFNHTDFTSLFALQAANAAVAVNSIHILNDDSEKDNKLDIIAQEKFSYTSPRKENFNGAYISAIIENTTCRYCTTDTSYPNPKRKVLEIMRDNKYLTRMCDLCWTEKGKRLPSPSELESLPKK